MRLTCLFLALLGVSLAGCGSPGTSQDYRIRLVPAPDGKGMVAIPPECPSWNDVDLGDPQDNVPWPTFGCATAVNLAAQVDRPEDLIEGEDMGPPDAIAASAAISRYQAGKTTPLIDPGLDSPRKTERDEDKRIGGGALK